MREANEQRSQTRVHACLLVTLENMALLCLLVLVITRFLLPVAGDESRHDFYAERP